MTLLKYVLVIGAVETRGMSPLSVVNIDAKLVCNYLALRVGPINNDPSLDLRGPIRLLLVNLRLA